MKNNIIKESIILSILLVLLSIILFDEISFLFAGMGIVVIGVICLYIINH